MGEAAKGWECVSPIEPQNTERRRVSINSLLRQCEGCLNARTMSCAVFTDPAYQWRSGKCYGCVVDPEVLIRRESEIKEYQERRGGGKVCI